MEELDVTSDWYARGDDEPPPPPTEKNTHVTSTMQAAREWAQVKMRDMLAADRARTVLFVEEKRMPCGKMTFHVIYIMS
jgi:hypothetical protein